MAHVMANGHLAEQDGQRTAHSNGQILREFRT